LIKKYQTKFKAPCERVLYTVTLLWGGETSPSPNRRDGRPPSVGCPRPLIRYIRTYPPYPEAIPLPATWGRSTLGWQKPTCYGN